MESVSFSFSHSQTNFIFNGTCSDLMNLISGRQAVILTDNTVIGFHPNYFKDLPVIVIPAGEDAKSLKTIGTVVEKLIDLNINRDALLIGFGGGVVSDVAGFVAGIYKRGISSAFVPTTVLAMVDAAIGGKNGINSGSYKNMIGLIRQPDFIFFDYSLLQTLPDIEWRNGMAEIIKHACIADRAMFEMLEGKDLSAIKKDEDFIAELIQRNALLKAGFVVQDEFDEGIRKQLNFGHTLGHAIEREKDLKHGFAVAIGMMFAARISKKMLGFTDSNRLARLLENYDLPVRCEFNSGTVLKLVRSDKKSFGDNIDFILLQKIGAAVTQPIAFDALKGFLNS